MREIKPDALPCQVECCENNWIPLADGQRLAATVWRPRDAIARPVPAILEYIPYSKRHMTRERDARMHPYLAAHGYACVRVDLRGSGESDGILADQYREQELDDGVQAVAWIAAQPWCDGGVGMVGISWGGFNALQVAARRPPALKAIITACSTDDLYLDNMHYMGGCLLTDNLSESTTMFSINSCPPDPALVGEQWREMWLDRLENSGLWLDPWLQHQRRDDYWRHGSVCEDYGAIQCPVMTVGGWADGYTNAVFRLLEHLQVPRQGLVGPWGHKYPHLGMPGPAIGFLQEQLRWWDHWLKGRDTGIMREPMIRAWMQDSVPPTTAYNERPGRWVGETRWPSPRIREQVYSLADLYAVVAGDTPGVERLNHGDQDDELAIQSPLSVGLFAGKWCSYTAAPDLPHDQREEDGGALVFETATLATDLEIMGQVVVTLEVASDRPVAMVAARLSDVAPDGKATRVTYGLCNLNHRNDHEQAASLEPGTFFQARVSLNNIAQRFPAGHRLRLSISTSYWPLCWGPPEPVRLTIRSQRSELMLPVRPFRETDSEINFAEPEATSPPATRLIEPEHHNWLVHRDLAEDISTLEVIQDEGVHYLEDIDLEVGKRTWNWYTCHDDDFESLQGETRTERTFRRRDWCVRTTTRTVLTADRQYFYVWAELDAWEHDKRIFCKNWNLSFARDFL
ncbi:peptidase S15 [Kineobactrum sediminis]|uniref:Peptidase S15 n=1 Tax=Kineobactrum sediminis TaxID=1905677 RepID=A0A2N5Y1I6_9GAMM|nr:CocE/NonD family hydrolase [Kineobactrum sediminis]PLW82260.1 peptidase S15 [Kineobactrum sediminis]